MLATTCWSAGTNGDFTSLTFQEKIRVCAEVVEEAGGQVKVFANAGTPSTYETILLSKELVAVGVDALAIITPYFIGCTQDGLINHFSKVADSVDKPVYLYDIPARTQNHIEPETAAKLADHPNILGIKDSGGSKESIDAYLEVANGRDDFDVLSGPDSLIYYALSNGAPRMHFRSRQCHANDSKRHLHRICPGKSGRSPGPAGKFHPIAGRSLRPRLSASHGQTRPLPDGQQCWREPPTSPGINPGTGCQNQSYSR